MAQPPLLIQEGNSVSRFVSMNARTTKCQNWRRHADTIAHKSEKMANLQTRALARVQFSVLSRTTLPLGLRLAALQPGIHPFNLDVCVVLQVPVVLLANVFFDLAAGNPADVPTNRERLCVSSGVIDGGFVMHIVVRRTREAFDQVHFRGMDITVAREPVSFIEADRIDDQRIPLPVADRMA